ncbi:uncharacterized protein [Panulirus ornatus]|uniref:uncharacterized protein n=1 Tax=Panulirus ornatus TaxID=150431 RepID=UPI003A8B65B3
MAGLPITLALSLLASRLLHAQTTGQWSRGFNSLGQQVTRDSNIGDFQNPLQQNPGVETPGSQSSDFDIPDLRLTGKGVDKGVNTDLTIKKNHQKVRPGNLTCYSCKLDFRKSAYKWDHPCLGRHNGLNVSTEYLVVCGPNDFFCRAERTEVNGVLITLTRECTDVCYIGCRPKGFGIGYEACAKCCNTDRCNHMYPLSGASTTILSLSTVFLGWFLVAYTHCP